jgi:class 3 adenylate cyclase
VFDAIVRNAVVLCGSLFANVFLFDGSLLHLGASHNVDERYFQLLNEKYPLAPDRSQVSGRVILERSVIQIEDALSDPDYDKRFPKAGQWRRMLGVPLLVDNDVVGVIVIGWREAGPVLPRHEALVQTFAAQAVIAIENVRQFKALEARTAEVQALNEGLEARVAEQVGEIERMGRLKRFMPPAVADAVVLAGDDKLLASHRALIATLFCDIRGFTAFCETAEPEETIEVLQTYHEQMGKLISAHGAGVDHRMGDGIMVLFNDPLPCDDPAGDALRLALAMRARMAELCTGWKRLGHRLGFGVGISLGYATVGMVGSEGRYEYTASGTAVNLAARLCDQAADGEILLSARAGIAVQDDFEVESGGELTLKGIHTPTEVFRVLGPRQA